MRMSINESRQHSPASKIDYPGVRACRSPDIRIGTNGDNSVAADSDRLGL